MNESESPHRCNTYQENTVQWNLSQWKPYWEHILMLGLYGLN